MEKKVIIGILPQVISKNNNILYDDRNSFVNIYAEKLNKCGADVIGLLNISGEISENTLNMCDAFLIQGGSSIVKSYYDVINYAIKKNKPLLGICLGMQSLAIYSMLVDNSNDYNKKDFELKYNNFKKEHNGMILRNIEPGSITHNTFINNDTIKTSFHSVQITDKSSILFEVYKKDLIDEASLHQYTPYYIGKEFKIVAKANDDIVEAIEYDKKGYFILGVQYHPELNDSNLLFERFVNETIKRKNI